LDGLNTRPTAERTKEAVFSKLQFDLEGREVLDLFSGSGQMGLEAVSRGAAHAVLCDKARDAVDVITRNAEKTRLKDKCVILCADYADCIERMAHLGKQFDIVFLDPPYASTMLAEALRLLCEKKLLRDGAFVVCESDKELVDVPQELSVVKQTKYGIAVVTIFTAGRENDQ
jgi:16S rRNA (guanine966-N2)-methyltransferase